MKRQWYRRILIMILALVVSLGGSRYFIEKERSRLGREVSADASQGLLMAGGMPIGIYMETKGALVLGTDKIRGKDGGLYEPSAHLVKKGDYIVGLNDREIPDKGTLVQAMKRLSRGEVVLKVRRNRQVMNVKIRAVKDAENSYKLGIWVRDDVQGIGTVTFLSADSSFGALGHGLHDADTGDLLEISEGMLYAASIRDIQRGRDGEPGGMEGIIVYNNYNILGSITRNTKEGIFGKIDRADALFSGEKPMKAAKIGEIKEGKAVIRCCVSGKIEDYDIRITKIDNHAREKNKRLEIEVTDKRLLSMTGGIVQGMSGSPIIQEGRLAGAVTHVFVHDPARGYGVFIEDMLKHIE